MEQKSYFDRPAQVVFADPDNSGEWLAGIAYHDEIICACCGGVFNIDDVIEMAEEDGICQAIYEYSEWNDVADEVVGGELPSGLFRDSDNKIVETCKMEEWVQMEIADEEATEAEAIFANTWVDGVAMPSID